ncbi:MAG: hypothetical protein GY851_11460 [bacterium]|nr:hypothetical protein [bacterium]
MRTLICGEDTALVVVVNEAYRCDSEGFFPTPAQDVTITFPRLPWLTPQRVQRVMPEGFHKGFAEVPARVRRKKLAWDVDTIDDVALFRVMARK